jgi:hypothetical protein
MVCACIAFLLARTRRGNGDVEIWNAESDWHMERVLPGGAATSVEALVWDRGRLFAGGLHSVITEWDVDTLSVEATADSYGGSVWCLAVSTSGDTLAAGCDDGSIKLYGLAGGAGSLEFVRSFDRQVCDCTIRITLRLDAHSHRLRDSRLLKAFHTLTPAVVAHSHRLRDSRLLKVFHTLTPAVVAHSHRLRDSRLLKAFHTLTPAVVAHSHRLRDSRLLKVLHTHSHQVKSSPAVVAYSLL